MSWKQDLRKLDACYDRSDLADLLGASQTKVTGALTGTRTPSPKLKRRIFAEMKRLRGDHVAGHEVAVYALQMAYQLRDADTRERRDEILRRCVPLLEHKAEGLRGIGEDVTVKS
jgi:hypothetical protein